MKHRIALLALAFGAGVATVHADEQKKPDEKQGIIIKGPGAPGLDADGEKEEPEFPPFDKETKGFQTTQGFWDVLWREKDQSLYAVIPASELEKPFLLTSSISGGIPQAGWQWADLLVAWERIGKKLVLVEKNVRYRAEPEKPIADAVVRTYSDRVLLATQIISQGPRGYLVNLREIFLDRARPFLDLSFDSSLAKVHKRKAFPGNVELAFAAPLSGDGTILTFHYSIARLPDPRSGFRPRLADDRIGYFLTAIKDFTGGDPAENRFVRLVNRWDLQKASPELALSPPKKPIVFYIEKTVPFRYRRWVEAGILEWNKAYEKVGFSNAVVVRQQTEDNEFKDFDPEDARYNFFRWIVSDEGYAMGPSRVDPRTGQILDADIVFDDSMVEFYAGEYETLLREGPKEFKGATRSGDARVFAERLGAALEPLGVRIDADRAATALQGLGFKTVPGEGAPARTRAELEARIKARRPDSFCRIGEGVRHEVSMGLALQALGSDAEAIRPRNVPEDFIGEIVKETVMHEVGHTLGLRHNFKASSYRTLEEINSPERPEDVSGSVMDYNALNIAPEGRPQGHWQNTTIGPYDFWAIEYGYRPGPDGRDLPASELAAIAARSNEPGHAYASDEDLGAADPLTAQWDMGADPVAYAKSRIAFARRLREKLMARAVRPGESWEKLREAFDMVLFEQARAARYAARLVGGQAVRRNHKGDPGSRPPVELVSAAVQRAGLQYACEVAFSDDSWKLPPELLSHLAAGRWWHWGEQPGNVTYPIHERILLVQRFTLDTLLSEGVLARLRDGQLKAAAGEDVLTIPELLGTIEATIFKELDGKPNHQASARAPFISTLRQNLQDYYVRTLTDLALAQQVPNVLVPNPAGKKLAQARLKDLEARCAGAVERLKLDEDSRAHLLSIGRHAQRAQAADYVHIASGCALSPGQGAPLALAPLAALVLLGLWLRRR